MPGDVAPKAAAPVKPKWTHELLLDSEMLLGSKETEVCDRFVALLAMEAKRQLELMRAKVARLPPPAPGAAFPDPEKFRVHVRTITPTLRVFQLLFDNKSPVVKTLMVDREQAISLASHQGAAFDDTRAQLKEWNTVELMEALEALVMNAAQSARKGGRLNLPDTHDDLVHMLDTDTMLDVLNRKDPGMRSTRSDALTPIDLWR